MIETEKPKKSGRWLLTEAEVADLLGMSPETLRLWRRKGSGPKFVRLGALIRYRPQVIRDFVRSREGAK